ncbi:hypothetical protein [Serratia marcescens]|uniref:hypothetical protein n=1 Tax=Serratia marcescens TaxID=615 RepID=UPI001116E85B|nr:hypothetical protein [Serratia marcescens]
MRAAILSGSLQLEILDCLYAAHPGTLTWYEFVEQFGELDDSYLIVNIQHLIADKLITPKAITINTGRKRIVTSKLKLTLDGYQFIAHNPPGHKR